MFTYSSETGHAYSDCERDDDWAQEIAMGHEAWLTAWAKKIIPDHVWTRVRHEATHYVISRWLRENGYSLRINRKTMHSLITKGDEVVSQYKVCLQSPALGMCRFCGQPLTLGSQSDVHPICTLKEHLEAAMAQRKTVRVG